MNKKYSIVIGLLILAVLIGAYSYVKLNPKQEEEVTTEQNPKIEIFNIQPENILEIQIISANEQELTLKKQEDKWIMNGENDTKVLQDKVDSIVNKLSDIKAEFLIEENVSDLSIYGLDNPYKIIVTSFDTKTDTFIMGEPTPTGDGYYFMKDGEKNVYMLSYEYQNIFQYTYRDLIEKEEIKQINIEKLNYLYIKQKDKLPIELLPIGEDENEKYELWNAIASWKIVKPYELPRAVADDEKFSDIINKIDQISYEVKDFVSKDNSDLSLYGLDNPELELIFKDSDGVEIHLYFGTYAQDGSIYFKQNTSNTIYTMNSSAIDLFFDMNIFDITDKFAMILSIEDVDKVILTQNDKETIFDVNTIKQKDDDGNETVEIECQVNGKQYPQEDFKKLYQNFIGIVLDSEYHGNKIEGKPVISIAFHMSDGKIIESKYYEYNDNYYVFDRNGTQEFISNKRQIDNVIIRMEDFFNGTISNQ